MNHNFSIPATDGFGIVEQTFMQEEGLPTNTEEIQRTWLMHHQAGLVQTAFLIEPRLQAVGGLGHVPFEELADVVFEEVWPLLGADQEHASYTLNSIRSEGELVVYRDATFLFSGLGWDQSPDFVVWRLPDVAATAPWPDVTSTDGPAVEA